MCVCVILGNRCNAIVGAREWLHFCWLSLTSCYVVLFGEFQVPSLLGEHKEVDQDDHYYQVPDEDHVVLVHLEHGGFGAVPGNGVVVVE